MKSLTDHRKPLLDRCNGKKRWLIQKVVIRRGEGISSFSHIFWKDLSHAGRGSSVPPLLPLLLRREPLPPVAPLPNMIAVSR